MCPAGRGAAREDRYGRGTLNWKPVFSFPKSCRNARERQPRRGSFAEAVRACGPDEPRAQHGVAEQCFKAGLQRRRNDVRGGGSGLTTRRTSPMPACALSAIFTARRAHFLISAICRAVVAPDAMSTFVAIDFETATTRRDSACAVGLAAGCDGRIVLSRTYLIQPPSAQFTFTDLPRSGLGGRARRPDLPGTVADAPGLDRRRRVRRRPQRAVRPQRPARLLRPVPAAPAADAVHLHRAACPRTMGHPADEAARRLPAAAHPAPSSRRGSGRARVRARHTRRRVRRLAGAWTPFTVSFPASNAPGCDSRACLRAFRRRPVAVGAPAAVAGIHGAPLRAWWKRLHRGGGAGRH